MVDRNRHRGRAGILAAAFLCVAPGFLVVRPFLRSSGSALPTQELTIDLDEVRVDQIRERVSDFIQHRPDYGALNIGICAGPRRISRYPLQTASLGLGGQRFFLQSAAISLTEAIAILDDITPQVSPQSIGNWGRGMDMVRSGAVLRPGETLRVLGCAGQEAAWEISIRNVKGLGGECVLALEYLSPHLRPQ